jgi:chemotaxis response regulator CheB
MRIGIVHDVPDDEAMLRRSLALKSTYRVIWSTKSGAPAVERCAKEPPDLVLLGLPANGMIGVETARQIMGRAPCPILIVTDSVRDDAARVFEAMGHGALDAVDMPVSGSGDLQTSAAALLAKIHTIARLIRNGALMEGAAASDAEPSAVRRRPSLVAIGASAGGPAAIAGILTGLPTEFPAAIVIVQHVDAQFTSGMAEWLGQQSVLPVEVAREGQQPAPGRVLLAGGSEHLVLKSADRLGYSAQPENCSYRPSVDVFFQSVCRHWEGEAVGVLLTGMGSDGSAGLRAMRDQGHHTIAQDRATSAVYGMPKAAVALDAAVEIVPMDRIAARLVSVIAGKAASARKALR